MTANHPAVLLTTAALATWIAAGALTMTAYYAMWR